MSFEAVPIHPNTNRNSRESMAVYYASRMAHDLRQIMPESDPLGQALAALLDAGYPPAVADAVVRRAQTRTFSILSSRRRTHTD